MVNGTIRPELESSPMKNRLELARYFAELGFKTGAEVGVSWGFYSKMLCENIPGLKLYCIDSWGYRHVYKGTLEILGPFIRSGQVTILKKKSMDALADIADESLDFVYIDADHSYDSVKEDINGWARKVRRGGIVSGHDYCEIKRKNWVCGVIQAVNEYVAEHNLDLKLAGLDKKDLAEDEREPSWYFIK
jgi:predicted O-methyltransferase YrrM